MSVIRVVKKFNLILSRHQKLRIFELGILMIIAGFMEMLSVSLILPFTEAVMNPAKFMEKDYVKYICDRIHVQDYRTFLIDLALLMAAVYVIKNAFLMFQMVIQSRFVNNNRFAVQKRLLANYLSRSYEFFLNVKSGEVMQTVNNDTLTAFSLLTTLLSFFSEMIVSITLVATIFVIAPGITLGVAALMLLMVGIIQVLFRPWIQRIGVAGRQASAKMHQWLLQSIQGIKEVKIMRREKQFERYYEEIGAVQVRSSYLYSTLSQFPRFMIEATSMAAFFLVIALMINRGVDLEAIVPMLSGVAMAAIRLLPSINRISAALSSLSYYEVSLDKLYEKLVDTENTKDVLDCENVDEPTKPLIDSDAIICLDKVDYKYPKGEKYILQDACLEIKKGESVGIVGASGAGKTTAMDIILGLLRPTSGGVYFKGKNIQLDKTEWLKHVGYIPQSIFMLDGTVRDNVTFGMKDGVNDKKVWKALKDAAIDDYIRTLPDGLDTELGEQGVRLSGGQKQRIGIARALYSEPDVLFFDEATSALDNETENAIMDSINKLHGTKTLIIIAHRLTTIEGCDHVYRVENQKIIRER